MPVLRHNDNSLSPQYSDDLPGAVKLYQVPEEYSEDGYYLAVWNRESLEPVPACAVEHALLLAHLRVTGPQQYEPIFLAQGVDYED